MKKLAFIFMFFSLGCFGQHSEISGTIRDKATGKPLVLAHIFIANTSVGSTSNAEGRFLLKEVPPGDFTIVCTMVGYVPFTGIITVAPGNLFEVNFELEESEYILEEVSVSDKEDKKWRKQFDLFERELLGDVPNADRCEIMNPWVVNFEEKTFDDTFLASAHEPLVIHNRYLGYKIHFLLTSFNIIRGQLTYIGYPSFQALQSGEMDQLENFLRNREDVYLGSTRHFFNALIHNRLKQEGFKLYRVSASANENWPRKIAEAISGGYLHSVDPGEIFKSDSRGIYKIQTDEVLEIIYTGKEWANSPYQDSPFQVSRIKLNESLTVNENGYVYNPASCVVYGFMAEERVANMLPYEYGQEILLR